MGFSVGWLGVAISPDASRLAATRRVAAFPVRYGVRARMLVWLGALLLAVAGAEAAARQAEGPARGAIAGRVVEASTGRPLPGVDVRILGTERVASSDSAGRFRFDGIAAGVLALEASALGHRPVIRTDVVVGTAKPASVTIRLESAPVEIAGIVVRPSAFPDPVEAPTSTQRIRAEEIRRAPGAQEDVVRAISVLPGVAPTAVNSNALVVRGGAPFENVYVVDGFGVGNINHFGAPASSGGQTSMINLDLVERVDFSAGGFGASRGERIGSVTTIELRDGLEERHAAELNLAITGFGALAEGPIGSGSYVAAARRSYLDLILDAAGETFFTRYWDANAKVTQRLGEVDELSWTFVGAVDEFGFNVETRDDAYDAALMATNDEQYFSSLTWTHRGDDSRFTLTAGRASHAYDIYQNDTLATPVFTKRSWEDENGLRAAYMRSYDGGSTLDLGAVARYGDRLRYDISLQGHLRPDADGTPRPLDVDTSFTALRAGAFAEGTVRWSERLSMRVGGRVDYYGHLGEAVRVAPRVATTFRLGGGTSLNLAAGRYWQAPSHVWLVGDPDNARRLEPIRADHAILGVQQLLGAEMKLQVETYYKWYGDYPARLWHPEAVVAPVDYAGVTSDVPFGLEPLASEGTGRAYGIELLLHKRLGEIPVYGLASLSVGRTEFAGLDGVDRPGSYDAPVIANVALGWKPGPLWDLGLRFRAASGHPTTPFITSGPDAGRLDLDGFNEGGRMPTFHALDVRIDRRWAFGGFQITTYLDIQDIYNRNNPIGHFWDDRTDAPYYETAIGTLPSVGINVEF